MHAPRRSRLGALPFLGLPTDALTELTNIEEDPIDMEELPRDIPTEFNGPDEAGRYSTEDEWRSMVVYEIAEGSTTSGEEVKRYYRAQYLWQWLLSQAELTRGPPTTPTTRRPFTKQEYEELKAVFFATSSRRQQEIALGVERTNRWNAAAARSDASWSNAIRAADEDLFQPVALRWRLYLWGAPIEMVNDDLSAQQFMTAFPRVAREHGLQTPVDPIRPGDLHGLFVGRSRLFDGFRLRDMEPQPDTYYYLEFTLVVTTSRRVANSVQNALDRLADKAVLSRSYQAEYKDIWMELIPRIPDRQSILLGGSSIERSVRRAPASSARPAWGPLRGMRDPTNPHPAPGSRWYY